MKPYSLEHLSKRAIEAHRNVSFVSEKRGESMIKDYTDLLQSDIAILQENNISEDRILEYYQKFEKFFSRYLSAKSNTFSVMITGASNFPVRRHEKANRSEHKHYEIFHEWRKRAVKAICRKPKEETTYVSEIDRYKAELVSLKKNHELMKEANKIIAKAKKENKDISDYLIQNFGIKPHMLEWTMKFGFHLQNNLANIKRVEGRIIELSKKETERQTEPEKEFLFNGGKVLMNYEVDRIQIFFDTRPTKDELIQWKSKGLNSFNWSPTNNAWQRKITANAVYATKHMIKSL